MIGRLFAVLVAVLILVAVGRSIFHGPPRSPTRGPSVTLAPPPARVVPAPAGPLAPVLPPAPIAVPAGCGPAPDFAAAAAQNAASLTRAVWSVFGRPETGWAIYAPLAAHEVGTACPPDAPGFASALARWQGAHGLAATGSMDQPTLDALRLVWLRRRPFNAQTAHGACPAPPPASALAMAAPAEGYHGKPVELRAEALQAYRAMVSAARREVAAVAADPLLLTLVSGYRGPEEERGRCATGGCGTPAKANCSAHRTGTAMDLYLGAAPGSDPASSADANRLFQVGGPAYRWLVANAARFGFVNYPFEPWHWEWAGGGPAG